MTAPRFSDHSELEYSNYDPSYEAARFLKIVAVFG
jgi:hypothetical protein